MQHTIVIMTGAQKAGRLMITDWQHELSSVQRVEGMTWTKVLGSWAELLSASHYICLITRTQSAVQLGDGIIIQAPDGEVFCLEAVGLSCGREEGWPTLLTFSPSYTCEAGWWLKSAANNGSVRHWQRTRRQTGRLISVRRRRKWPNSQWNTAASHHLNVPWMRWSLHVVSWLLSSNGQWTGNIGIMKKKSLDMEGHSKHKLFLSYTMSFIIRETGIKLGVGGGVLEWVRWSTIQ